MRLPRQSRGVSFLFLNFGICSARQTPPVLPCRTAVKTETLKRSLFGIYETDYVKNRFYRGIGRAFLVLWYADAAAFGVVFCHGTRLPHRHDKSLWQHRTIAEASAVESPIRQETIGFPAHFFARAHNFKPPGRACQPEADSPMRT